MSKKILALNWKSNPVSLSESCDLYLSYKISLQGLSGFEKILFAPTLFLPDLIKLAELNQIDVELGAQDVSARGLGAFTSEIAAEMLLDAGIKNVLIGHSETRSNFNLSDEDVAGKLKQCLTHHLRPILCLGFQRQNEAKAVNFNELELQIVSAIQPNLDLIQNQSELVLAYEPVWAIGSGKTPDLSEVEEVADWIRNLLEQRFSPDLALKTKILYGGSLNETNIQSFADSQKLQGVLIGGASLSSQKMSKIGEVLQS